MAKPKKQNKNKCKVASVYWTLYTESLLLRTLLMMVPKMSLQMPSHNSRRLTWTPCMVPYWEQANGLWYRWTGHIEMLSTNQPWYECTPVCEPTHSLHSCHHIYLIYLHWPIILKGNRLTDTLRSYHLILLIFKSTHLPVWYPLVDLYMEHKYPPTSAMLKGLSTYLSPDLVTNIPMFYFPKP